MNMLKLTTSLLFFTTSLSLAGDEINLNLKDVKFSEAWSLVSNVCPLEAGDYKLRNPNKLITFSTEKDSCKIVVNAFKKMDITQD